MSTSIWKSSNEKWYYLKDNGQAASDCLTWVVTGTILRIHQEKCRQDGLELMEIGIIQMMMAQ